MPAELTSEAVRGAQFAGSFRGYARGEVDTFRSEVAETIETLESRVATLAHQVRQLGIEEVPDLRAEIERVGSDITAILGEAERTATDLRQRASEDSTQWVADAEAAAAALRIEAEVTSATQFADAETAAATLGAETEAAAAALRTEAQATTEQMRGDAWRDSTEMLRMANDHSQRLLDAAAQDELFMRAEAERETLRTTAETRKEADEILRRAREEAGHITVEARAEGDRLIEDARRAAEAAQERTLALETRRAALMVELDATRHNLSELGEAPAAVAANAAEPAADEPTMPSTDGESVWEDDEGSVKVLPSGSPISDRVDADEMVAEVERLRSAGADEPELRLVVEAEPEPEPIAEAMPEPEPDVEPEADPIAEVMPEPEPVTEAEPEPVAVTDEEPATVEFEPASQPEPEPSPDALQDLFAELRTDDSDTGEPGDEEKPEVVASDDAASSGDGEEQDEPAASLDDESPVGVMSASFPDVSTDEAFDLRDRLLLPIQNEALRGVKRHIVDLQNHVLDELRIVGEDGWQPDAAAFTESFGEDLDNLVRATYAAGHAAAGEMTGGAEPTVSGSPTRTNSATFAEAMASAAADAHDREGDAGVRQRSAAVSRVFRAWRTDEAERRLRSLAFEAYHEGVVSGLAKLGVQQVHAITDGSLCAECPVGVDATWDPADGIPADIAVPPVHPGCMTTVVPSGTSR